MARYGRALAISVVTGLMVIGTLPAQAKGFGLNRLVIRGPGLAEPLSLSRQQFGVPTNQRHPAAIALEGMLGRFPKSERPPSGTLGPRYEFKFELELIGGRVVALRQAFYPYAEVGPMTFTPAGQAVNFSASPWRFQSGDVHDVKPGWLPFPEEQVNRLQRYGLPSDARAERQQPAGSSRDQTRAALWPLVGVTGALLCLGMTLAFYRRGYRRRLLTISHLPSSAQRMVKRPDRR